MFTWRWKVWGLEPRYHVHFAMFRHTASLALGRKQKELDVWEHWVLPQPIARGPEPLA